MFANIGPNIRSSHVINEGNKISSMLKVHSHLVLRILLLSPLTPS
jgi:hypothetical protein